MNRLNIDVSPFHLPRLALVIGFCLVAAGGCFDYQFSFLPFNLDGLHRLIGWTFMAALILADREGPRRPRMIFTTLALLALGIYSYILRHNADHISAHAALRLCLNSGGFYWWVGALWLASPFFTGRPGCYGLPLRIACIALCIYGCLCFASAIASISPERSMQAFDAERAFCLGLIFAWLRVAARDTRLSATLGRMILWLLAGLMLGSVLIGLLDLLGGPAVRHWTSGLGLVRVDPTLSGTMAPVRRLEFPMLHFNRTSLLTMMAIFFFLLGSTARSHRWKIEGRVGLMILPALAVMLMSMSRGALIAAIAGLLLYASVISRKALAAIVIAGLVLVMMMPASRRNFLMQIFKAETYRPTHGQLTSMSVRLWAWDFAIKSIADHPVSGIGYGTHIVRDSLDEAMKATGHKQLIENQDVYPLVHVHNVWLEIAVESGLPALLAFMVFSLARWWMLLSAFRGASPPETRRLAAWLALELAIGIAGIVYYMLKLNSGMIFWFAWAYEMSELETLRLQRCSMMPPPGPTTTATASNTTVATAATPIA